MSNREIDNRERKIFENLYLLSPQFRTGAFAAGNTVQPVALRFSLQISFQEKILQSVQCFSSEFIPHQVSKLRGHLDLGETPVPIPQNTLLPDPPNPSNTRQML